MTPSVKAAHEDVMSAMLRQSRDAVRKATDELNAKRLARYRENCTLKTIGGDQLGLAAKMLLAEAARSHTIRPPQRDSPRVRQVRSPGAPRYATVCQGQPRYNLADVRTATVVAVDIDKLMELEVSPLRKQRSSLSQRGALLDEPAHVLNYQYVMCEMAKLRMWS